MGTRMVEQPYCDADREDVKEVKTFTWTEDDGTSYRIQLGAGEHACYGSLMTVLGEIRPNARKLSEMIAIIEPPPSEAGDFRLTEDEPSDDEPAQPAEPVEDEPREAFPTGFRSSSATGRDDRAECRIWWRRKWRAEKLPEPPETNRGRIPAEVVAAWEAHKGRLASPKTTVHS